MTGKNAERPDRGILRPGEKGSDYSAGLAPVMLLLSWLLSELPPPVLLLEEPPPVEPPVLPELLPELPPEEELPELPPVELLPEELLPPELPELLPEEPEALLLPLPAEELLPESLPAGLLPVMSEASGVWLSIWELSGGVPLGFSTTVMTISAVFSPAVPVMMAVPTSRAETTPFSSTRATEASLLVQVILAGA